MILSITRSLCIRIGLSCATRCYVTNTGKYITILDKSYETSKSHTNITTAILSLVDRSLHMKNEHPIGILRKILECKLNSIDNAYKTYGNFKPVVTVEENFDFLGFDKNHPGRSKSDTYYVNSKYLLRTHTSAHEKQCFMNMYNKITDKPGFLLSADVYRRDEIDKTHYPVFHQMEGCRVWKRDLQAPSDMTQKHILELQEDIAKLEHQLRQEKIKIVIQDDDSLENNPKQDYMTDLEVDLCARHLKRSVELIIAEVFNKKLSSTDVSQLKVRWIKAHFPWTAPSWEIEVWWKDRWLELCGCGLVNQRLYTNVGNKADSLIGWAFGLGLDRIAMLLFDIPDIRLFWTRDQRFHSQFKPGKITTFKPYSRYPGSTRDVAFWLSEQMIRDQIHENDFMEIVRNHAGDLVESVKLVDEFQHPKTKRRSLCYRINFQSMDRNLTNDEINKIQKKVCDELVTLFDVELR